MSQTSVNRSGDRRHVEWTGTGKWMFVYCWMFYPVWIFILSANKYVIFWLCWKEKHVIIYSILSPNSCKSAAKSSKTALFMLMYLEQLLSRDLCCPITNNNGTHLWPTSFFNQSNCLISLIVLLWMVVYSKNQLITKVEGWKFVYFF